MNLSKLFETQRKLDERIVKEKGLEGQDLLPQKILALQVELGECANEWRGFKFWSENQEPRTYKEDFNIKTDRFRSFNPLLEEYVDCLHFILSIGLDLGFAKDYEYIKVNIIPDTTIMFNRLFELIAQLKRKENFTYYSLLNEFVGFGIEGLGFTWEQIEQAYYDKNKINHERQANGY